MLNLNFDRKEKDTLILKEEIPISQTSLTPFENRDFIVIPGDLHSIKNNELSFSPKDVSLPFTSSNNFTSQFTENQIENSLKDLSKNPNNPFLLNTLGITYLNTNQLDKALDLFTQALNVKQDFKIALLNLAILHEKRGDYEKALLGYFELLKFDPNDIRALLNINNIYLRQNKLSDAKAIAKQILKTDSKNISAQNNLAIIALLENKFSAAIAQLRKCLSINNNLFQIYNNIGVAYALSGSLTKALSSFKIAIKINSSFIDAIHNLATTYNRTGDIDSAIDLLETYLQTSENLSLREDLSRYYLINGKFNKSLYNLKKVIDISIKSNIDNRSITRLYNNLGVIYHKMGDFAKAEGTYLISLKGLSKVNLIILQNLIDLYFEFNNFRKGREFIEILNQEFGDIDLYFYYLARYNFHQLSIADAISNLEIFLQKNQHFPPAYCLLSTIYSEFTREYDKAIRLNEQAIASLPNNLSIINNLAYSYLMNDNIREAELILNRVRDISKNIYIYATTGLLEIKKGHIEEGRRLYNLAAEIAPNETLRNLALQKKNLELGKFYLKETQLERARELLYKATTIGVNNSQYAIQANELLNSIS